MHQKIEMQLLAFKIEWHWFFIIRGRKKGYRLLDKGLPFTSKEILRLSERLDYHCNRVNLLTNRYRELTNKYPANPWHKGEIFIQPAVKG